MLAEGAGTIMHQEGYGMEFHVEEALSNGGSLTDTIVKYDERASMANSKVSEFKGRLSMIEIGSNNAQPPPGYLPHQQMQEA